MTSQVDFWHEIVEIYIIKYWLNFFSFQIIRFVMRSGTFQENNTQWDLSDKRVKSIEYTKSLGKLSWNDAIKTQNLLLNQSTKRIIKSEIKCKNENEKSCQVN